MNYNNLAIIYRIFSFETLTSMTAGISDGWAGWGSAEETCGQSEAAATV